MVKSIKDIKFHYFYYKLVFKIAILYIYLFILQIGLTLKKQKYNKESMTERILKQFIQKQKGFEFEWRISNKGNN